MVTYEDMIKRGLEQCNDEHYVRIMVRRMMDNWVPELEPNMQEWINHKPFSDIRIGELTLNAILDFWGEGTSLSGLERAMREFRDYVDRDYTHPEVFRKWFI